METRLGGLERALRDPHAERSPSALGRHRGVEGLANLSRSSKQG